MTDSFNGNPICYHCTVGDVPWEVKDAVIREALRNGTVDSRENTLALRDEIKKLKEEVRDLEDLSEMYRRTSLW